MIVTGKRKEKNAEPEETPAPLPIGAKEEDMKIRYILPAVAYAEETSCAIRSEDGTSSIIIQAKFGIYEVPNDENRDATVKMLEKSGWKFLEAIEEDGDADPALEEKIPQNKYASQIKLAHPDISDDNKPTTLLTFDVAGENVDANMEAGIIKTDNPGLVRVLVDKGYRVLNPHTLEKEEEKLK